LPDVGGLLLSAFPALCFLREGFRQFLNPIVEFGFSCLKLFNTRFELATLGTGRFLLRLQVLL
jgi:hypothetical protein